MKKLIFLAVSAAVILLPAVHSYGQDQTWGTWGKVGCFNGIEARARRSGDEPGKYGYTWYIQFRNNYRQKVAFGFTMKANSQESDEYIKVNGGQYRTEIEANSADSGLMTGSVNNFSSLNVKLGYFRFIKEGEVDVGQPFERCDDGTNAIDDLCAFKPASSCANYKKPVDKTAAANSTDSRNVNKTPATLAQCNVLMKTYKASVDKMDSTEAGLAKGKSLISSGEEILNRCKTKFAKSVFGEIEGKVADAKEFLAGYDKEPNQDSVATLGETTTKNSDLSAQPNENKADELKRKIFENLKVNLLDVLFEYNNFNSGINYTSKVLENENIVVVERRYSIDIGPAYDKIYTYKISFKTLSDADPLSEETINTLLGKPGYPPAIECSKYNNKCSIQLKTDGGYETFYYNFGKEFSNLKELRDLLKRLQNLNGK